MISFYCWFTSNLEFCFLQIVLENAAPIANDMVAADPSSTVVHSLRRKQNSLHFAFQIFFFLKRLNFCHVSCLFKIKKESECFSFSLFVLVPYVSFMSSPSHMTVALPNSYSHHSSISTRLRIQKQEHYQKKKKKSISWRRQVKLKVHCSTWKFYSRWCPKESKQTLSSASNQAPPCTSLTSTWMALPMVFSLFHFLSLAFWQACDCN